MITPTGVRAPAPWILMASIAGLLLGCDSTSPSAPPKVPDCLTSPVAITVGAGLTPTFTWTPVCQVGLLLVEDSATADMWVIRTPPDTSTVDRNTIQPVVTYGSVPVGAVEAPPLVPLVAGATYTVYLIVNNGNGSVSTFGVQPFTP